MFVSVKNDIKISLNQKLVKIC